MASTLADPTNYGNGPGAGPLRSGGVSVSEPLQESDLPSTKSVCAAEQVPALEIVRDAWEGTAKIRDKTTKYLPQAPGEDRLNYSTRLERSVFHNYFRRTVEGLTGLVFSKDPILSKDVPKQTRDDWENIDNCGTHGDVFLRQRLQDALIDGHCAILVDYPDTGGTQDAYDEFTLRPYWVPLFKENMVSWRTEVINGKTVLRQLVLKESSYVPSGSFGEREQTLYRVLFRIGATTSDAKIGWYLLEVTPSREIILHGSGFYNNQIEIPVAEVISSGSKSMFESAPPLMDLAYLNIAHYQQWSDYATSIHKTCVPLLFGNGFELPDGDKMITGPNTSIIVPNPSAGLSYVSHDGNALGSCEKALENLKSDIGTMGVSMLSSQKRVAESAEAKRLDKSSTDSSLAVTARGLQDAAERAMEFHAQYYQIKDGGSIEINRDYEGVLMDSATMAAFAALVAQGLPWEVALEQLQRGGRIAADVDVTQLAQEVANREAKIKEAEAAAATALADAKKGDSGDGTQPTDDKADEPT